MELRLKEMADLQKEVDTHIPALINSLADESQSASLTIKLTFKRAKDTETGIIMSHAVKPTYPATKKQVLCRRDLCGNLTVDRDDINSSLLPLVQPETNLQKERKDVDG